MRSVYLLWHMHRIPDSDVDAKLLGVYSTRERAEERQEQARKLEGFRDAPDGFLIDECPVDRDQWPEGYITAPYYCPPDEA